MDKEIIHVLYRNWRWNCPSCGMNETDSQSSWSYSGRSLLTNWKRRRWFLHLCHSLISEFWIMVCICSVVWLVMSGGTWFFISIVYLCVSVYILTYSYMYFDTSFVFLLIIIFYLFHISYLFSLSTKLLWTSAPASGNSWRKPHPSWTSPFQMPHSLLSLKPQLPSKHLPRLPAACEIRYGKMLWVSIFLLNIFRSFFVFCCFFIIIPPPIFLFFFSKT